jgi:hypothetical protein
MTGSVITWNQNAYSDVLRSALTLIRLRWLIQQ